MHDLTGRNIVVIDLETMHSADACRYCRFAKEVHALDHGFCPPEAGAEHLLDHYEALGWEDHAALGLSIGCWFDYRDGLPHWFDRHTLEATMRVWVARQPLLVSFNGIRFDFPLMGTVLRQQERMDSQYDAQILSLCDAFLRLAARSYDILDSIWTVYGRSTERRLHSLDALCQANGLPAKEMDGATAPRLWQAGRIAEVIQYCQNDVVRTQGLFELVCAGTPLVRGDGTCLTLPVPRLERT